MSSEDKAIKRTSIDPSLIDETNAYRHSGPARLFTTEAGPIGAIKRGLVTRGDVIALICGWPAGAGMQEIYQNYRGSDNASILQVCRRSFVCRFSGCRTGAYISHISPKAPAGGERFSAEEGSRRPLAQTPRNDLASHLSLPDDTCLWAALVEASGGVCVYDAGAIIARLAGNTVSHDRRLTPQSQEG